MCKMWIAHDVTWPPDRLTTTEVTVLSPSFDLLEHKVHDSLSSIEMQNENGEVVRSPIYLGPIYMPKQKNKRLNCP
jgi:hypothetical protein